MRRLLPTLAIALALAALVWGFRAWVAPDTPAPGGGGPGAAPLPRVAVEPPPAPELPPAEAAEPPAESETPAWFDEAGEPSPALLRAVLAEAIAEHLPGHKLSSEELDQLAEAAFRLREAQRAFRALPGGEAHAEERRALVEEIQAAGADFTYVLEMTPDEFTARVQTDAGIDAFIEDEALPEPEYLDDLR